MFMLWLLTSKSTEPSSRNFTAKALNSLPNISKSSALPLSAIILHTFLRYTLSFAHSHSPFLKISPYLHLSGTLHAPSSQNPASQSLSVQQDSSLMHSLSQDFWPSGQLHFPSLHVWPSGHVIVSQESANSVFC